MTFLGRTSYVTQGCVFTKQYLINMDQCVFKSTIQKTSLGKDGSVCFQINKKLPLSSIWILSSFWAVTVRRKGTKNSLASNWNILVTKRVETNWLSQHHILILIPSCVLYQPTPELASDRCAKPTDAKM